jgi:uncharacterized membrane protein
MGTLKEFLKATIVGGLMFLVPLVLLLLVLSNALRLVGNVARPIAAHLELTNLFGAGAVTVVGALVLILISFLAGIVAHTGPGRRITRWFEESFLGGLPQYQMMKSLAEGLAKIQVGEGMRPVLVSIEEGWQIGYLLEHLEHDWVAVFVPQAPTPMSGNVMYLPGDRVRALDMTMMQAMSIVKRLGFGSSEALRGVDLQASAAR